MHLLDSVLIQVPFFRHLVSTISYFPRTVETLTTFLGGQGGYATNFSGGLSGSAESQLVTAVFKTLVTRFVDEFKELKAPENSNLYSDIRQLITYVKGAHGGPFRRVALSGVLAVTPRPHKKVPPLQKTRVIRHISLSEQCAPEESKSQRKLLFKKRSTSSTCAVSTIAVRYKTSPNCNPLHSILLNSEPTRNGKSRRTMSVQPKSIGKFPKEDFKYSSHIDTKAQRASIIVRVNFQLRA